MIKKLCCLLTAVVILICIYPSNVLASSVIDLSRVKFKSGSEPLVLKFGDISLEGEVRNDFPFTEEEIDKIVKDTLKSMGLSELDIKEDNQIVEKARRASEFTKEDMQRVKDNFIKSMKVVPKAGKVADILSVIDKYMNSSSWDDIGTASADLLENSAKDWVKDTASGFVDKSGKLRISVDKTMETAENLVSIVEFCDMLADEHARTKQKWKSIADGANAKRRLNDFYSKLQSRIESYKYKSDRSAWIIDFRDAMDGRNFTFFGVDSNYQIWRLDMYLKQTQTNRNGSAAGYYEGEFNLTAEHDMSSFTSRAHEAVRNMGELGTAIKKVEKTPGYIVKLTTTSSGSASILRTINGDCEANIEESGNITFSMKVENDDTRVRINGVEVDMNFSSKGSNKAKGVGQMSFQISAQEEDIIVGGGSGNLGLIMPNVKSSFSFNGSGTMNVGWDNGIWKPWEGTEKTLEHAGK